jgi:hypothetical protein
MPKHIHLIFKTHLDIGFTDHASKVRRQYHEQFIPQAIATGEHFFAENPQEPAFIWTTGAWLIWDHLNSQAPERVRRLERAIERGLIAWHALPFTTHTELMSPAVFRAGLSYAQELDRRFGKTSVAAKMTDVPGHTLGMVPLLAQAGVKFLHLGVNTASPVPDVPPIFVWRAPDGAEIVVMYQASYGETDYPAGDDLGLSFAHTNDNIGPQSVGQTVEALRGLRHAHPEAVIKASTLDAFGAEMWARRAQFPLVTKEIGDSWIHGTATDPEKLARFRALQRLYDGFEHELTPARLAFGRGLAMVAEHTWGVDIKTYLRDETAWDRLEFEAARAGNFRFGYTEQSWAEQRGYLNEAIAQLEPEDKVQALAASAEPTPFAGLADGGWSAECDPVTGDVVRLTTPAGQVIAGNGTLLAYRYESYDWTELQQHLDSYLQHRIEWAILDHDKPGLQHARTAQTAVFAPESKGDGHAVMPELAHRELGAPERIRFGLRAISATRVEIGLTLLNKPANRMPEASFLAFTPAGGRDWQFEKLGLWQAASNVVWHGGGQLQAISALQATTGARVLKVTPLDCALVAPVGTDFMPFAPEPPDFSQGVRINIHNNKWGTNFPMWCEGDIHCRLVLEINPA